MGWILAHPLLCAALLFALWWIGDRIWIRAWSPERWLLGRRQVGFLRRKLTNNPYDRDARHKLATELVERGGHREALELLERNIAEGERDTETFVLAGVAAFGIADADACERATAWIERAREKGTRLTLLEMEITLARGWMQHRRFAEALPPLLRYVEGRPGSVEVYARLAQVHAELGDADAAERCRERGTRCWLEKPRFQRRLDRPWAWRLRPWRGVAHVGSVAVAIIGVAWLLSRIDTTVLADAAAVHDDEFLLDLQGWQGRRLEPTPTPARFELREPYNPWEEAQLVVLRSLVVRDDQTAVQDKDMAADFFCRLPESYGRPSLVPYESPDNPLDAWRFRDVETDAEIYAIIQPGGVLYVVYASDQETAIHSVFAFEQMIEEQPLRDCTLALRGYPGVLLGIRDGKPITDE